MGGSASALVPELHSFSSTPFTIGRGPGRSSLAQDLERLLAPSPAQVLSIRARSDAHHARLSDGESSRWDGNECFIPYNHTFTDHPAVSDHRMDTLAAFWGRFHRDCNPWIQGSDGKTLGRAKYARIPPCSLRSLCIRRLGPQEFLVTFPSLGGTLPRHLHRILQRWATSILLSSPHLAVGAGPVEPGLVLRHPPPFRRAYQWSRVRANIIVGSCRDPEIESANSSMRLRQDVHGIHSSIEGELPELRGSPEQVSNYWKHPHHRVLVFHAHPELHKFPWSVPETVDNVDVWTTILRQAFFVHKRHLHPALQSWLKTYDAQAVSNSWQSAPSNQKPSHV